MLTDTTPDSLFWAKIFDLDFLELEDPFAIWSLLLLLVSKELAEVMMVDSANGERSRKRRGSRN